MSPFSLITGDLWRAACVAALAIAAVQTARIEGMPIIGGGLKADLVASERRARANFDAHVQTIRNYRQAQAEAARAETQRLARVREAQKGVDADVSQNLERRLADLRARAGELRRPGPAGAGSPAGGIAVPGFFPAAGGADAATCGDGFSLERRLIASEQSIQLDELIDWVGRQAGIDPNEQEAPR